MVKRRNLLQTRSCLRCSFCGDKLLAIRTCDKSCCALIDRVEWDKSLNGVGVYYLGILQSCQSLRSLKASSEESRLAVLFLDRRACRRKKQACKCLRDLEAVVIFFMVVSATSFYGSFKLHMQVYFHSIQEIISIWESIASGDAAFRSFGIVWWLNWEMRTLRALPPLHL